MKSSRMYWLLGLGALAVVVALVAVRTPSVKPPVRKITPPQKTVLKKEPVISLYHHATNSTERISLEKYLEGVVAAEIGPNQPTEALKAQAIAARSLVMQRIESGGVRVHNTDVCDSPEHFQAYDANKVTPAIRSAVRATRGQVLAYKGKAAYALFHSYSPGKTADIKEYFPELAATIGAYIKSVDSPGARFAPAQEKSWELKVNPDELKKLFGSSINPRSLKVSKRGPSGRAVELSADNKTVKGSDLRAALGGERLKSTYITSICVVNGQLVFKGKGWGHGCGMSQWGAFAMAKDGRQAAEILSHYYPGTRLTAMWK